MTLNPDYKPSGIITDTNTAFDILAQANLTVPCPANPKCDPTKWKKIIELFDVSLITKISTELRYDLSNVFKTLSLRLDPETPYTTSDIINVKVSPCLQHQKESETAHCEDVFKFCIEQLPPVTSGLIGGYLSEVRIFDRDEYIEKMLPEGKRYGGMHKPYRKSIDILGNCRCKIQTMSEPDEDTYMDCTFIHELGHVVHNIYGALRPGDHGFTYPSDKNTLDSTGLIEPLRLSRVQYNFIYDLIRAYVYTQMDCYDTIRFDDYSTQHPVEAFACAFEFYLRKGDSMLYSRYPQFQDVFSHLK